MTLTAMAAVVWCLGLLMVGGTMGAACVALVVSGKVRWLERRLVEAERARADARGHSNFWRSVTDDAREEVDRLRARVAELEAEVKREQERLVEEVGERLKVRARVAELEAEVKRSILRAMREVSAGYTEPTPVHSGSARAAELADRGKLVKASCVRALAEEFRSFARNCEQSGLTATLARAGAFRDAAFHVDGLAERGHHVTSKELERRLAETTTKDGAP